MPPPGLIPFCPFIHFISFMAFINAVSNDVDKTAGLSDRSVQSCTRCIRWRCSRWCNCCRRLCGCYHSRCPWPRAASRSCRRWHGALGYKIDQTDKAEPAKASVEYDNTSVYDPTNNGTVQSEVVV